MRFASRLAMPALLVLVTVAFYWKLTLSNQHTWIAGSDAVNLEVPRLQLMASEWHHMRFPLWDPYQWAGQPFLGQITGAAAPLNIPLALLGFKDGKVRQSYLHWYWVLLHYLGALFAYWLARDVGASRAASVLAGSLFAFTGYMATSDWPPVMNGSLWAPLVVLFLLRAIEGRAALESAALSGSFCGLAWLSGHHQAPYYLSLAVGGAFVVSAAARRSVVPLVQAAAAGTMALLVGGLQLLPGWEYGRLAHRWAGAPEPLTWKQAIPFSVHENWAFRPADLVGVLVPHAGTHTSAYLGVVGLALVVAGLVACWNRRTVRILAYLALAAMALGMSGFNWIYGVFYTFVPLFEKSRVPARTVLLFSAALAPVAALGLDALGGWAGRVRLWRTLAFTGSVALAAAVGLHLIRYAVDMDRLVWMGAMAVLTAALAARSAHPAWFALLFLVDAGSERHFERTGEADPGWPVLWAHRDIAEFLKTEGNKGPVRVDVNSGDVAYNFGDWHGIETMGGFGAGVTSNLIRLEWHTPRVHDLMGVTHSVSRESKRPGQELVFRGASGVNVYRNPSAFPRAWIAHESLQVENDDWLRVRMQDAAVDLRRVVLAQSRVPELARCEGEEGVRWIHRRAASLALEATAGCTGMLVVGDTNFPGWKAWVDGAPAAVHEVDGSLRGVVVPAGKHVVEFRYRPWTAGAGAVMTVLGLALTVVVARRARAA